MIIAGDELYLIRLTEVIPMDETLMDRKLPPIQRPPAPHKRQYLASIQDPGIS